MATPIPDNRARFTLDEILSATGGVVVGSTSVPPTEVAGVKTDSRAIVAGNVFVALRGDTHDGHAYVPVAARNGARVALVERGRWADVPGVVLVEVADTLVAFGDLARAHLDRWRADANAGRRVVAITGSAGKTTTKELTAALLRAVAPTHFTAGNLNNRIGVPAVVLAIEDRHRFAVLEMGMSLPGELDAITSIAAPDVSVVTNVGLAHSEGVGGREGVMKEKAAVYRALSRDGVAVVNADDAYVVRASQETRARRVTFGRSEDARYRLVDRTPDGAGSRVGIARPSGRVEVALPLAGEVAALDLAAALAAQESASDEILSSAAIDAALAAVDVAGRATVRRLGGGTIVLDDTYNANPASMRAALTTLAEIAGERRRVVVLGEMKELGALAEDEHDSLGDAVASAAPALAIGCGGLATRTIERARQLGVADAIAAKDTAEATELATARVRPGDAVLVKGSRGVAAERVVAALVAALGPELGGTAPETLPFSPESARSRSS